MTLDALLGSLIVGGKPRLDLEERFTPEIVGTALEQQYITCDFGGCRITDAGKSVFNARIAKQRQLQLKPQALEISENAVISVDAITITASITEETPKPPILGLEEIEETMPKSKPHLTKAAVLAALDITGNTVTELVGKLHYPAFNIQAIVKKAFEDGKIQRSGTGGRTNPFRYYSATTQTQLIDDLEPYREVGRKIAREVIEETIVEAAQTALENFEIPQHKHPPTQIPVSQDSFKHVSVADPEILAINQIATALRNLEPRAAARVLDWATARFVETPMFGGHNV